MHTSADRDENMETAAHFVNEASDHGARVISLPEMWNCPYENALFGKYAEDEGGPSFEFMSDLARQNEIFLIGGSVPESDNGGLYNTSYIFGSDGNRIGKHRKVHLFDVDVTNGIHFRESDTLSAGDQRTVVDTDFGKIGVAICYDVRFPEMIEAMADAGAYLVVLPASFSMSTGPDHWEILMRARALDNQIYFAACSPSRDINARYQAYGHSLIVNPWGNLIAAAAVDETVIYGDIDLDYLNIVRQEIPVRAQRDGR
jgi:predicted amidohydrolase